MSRAEQKREARDRILAAAARQLREEGLTGASVQRVMDEAGLTHGGFYGHFESREQLIGEALTGAFKKGRDRLLTGATSAPQQRRRQMLRRYLSRSHRDSPGEGCPLPSTSADVARSPASVRHAYDAELRKIIAFFETERSDLGAEDAHTGALGTLALCVGSLLLSRAALDPTLSDDILSSCRQFAAAAEETTEHED
ncbi:MAG: TetR/AcrR family transcriptional regulator [bacterium]|nr:TetR/AcrR family transcriptional regulator [bacterium]